MPIQKNHIVIPHNDQSLVVKDRFMHEIVHKKDRAYQVEFNEFFIDSDYLERCYQYKNIPFQYKLKTYIDEHIEEHYMVKDPPAIEVSEIMKKFGVSWSQIFGHLLTEFGAHQRREFFIYRLGILEGLELISPRNFLGLNYSHLVFRAIPFYGGPRPLNKAGFVQNRIMVHLHKVKGMYKNN